jgi:hypothetical protein
MSTSGSARPAGTSSAGAPRRPTFSEDSAKPAKPEIYYGERHKLNNWLLQMDLYFRINASNIDERNKVVVAVTFMRGRVLTWINSDLQKYLDGEAEQSTVRWMESFGAFKARIRHVFGPSNEESAAESMIQRLKQLKSAADYATTFQHYAGQTEWNDEALMSMYKRGLKDNVQDELMRHGGTLDTLQELMKTSIEYDDKLHQRALERMEKRGGNPYKEWGGGTSNYRSGGFRRDTDLRGDPMELDVLTPTRGRQDTTNPRKCYTCGKPGHIARNCRSKDKVRRQLNVLQGHTKIPADYPYEDESSGDTWDKLTESEAEEESVPLPKKGKDVMKELTQQVANIQYDTSEDEPGPSASFKKRTNQRTGLARKEVSYPQPSHRKDWRNHQHYRIHWTSCFYDDCDKHLKRKEEAGWYPVKIPTERCKAEKWMLCTEDECCDHLWDKRRNITFPGHDNRWHERVRNDRHTLRANCTTNKWETCLYDRCRQHKSDKEGEGFLPLKTTQINVLQQYRQHEKKPNLKERISFSSSGESTPWEEIDDEEFKENKPPLSPEPLLVRKKTTISDEQRGYSLDPRNPRHQEVYWMTCTSPECELHQQDKEDQDYQPNIPDYMKCGCTIWETCTDNKCVWHLTDKRNAQHFPGHTDLWYERFKFGLLTERNWCDQEFIIKDPEERGWQLCLKPQCPQHVKEKRKYGFDTRVREINLTTKRYEQAGYETYIAIPLQVNGRRTVALLDTGATANFISKSFAGKTRISLQKKKQSYQLTVANGEGMPNSKGITYETTPIRITIQQHNEVLKFDVLEMATHDFILGMPWLKMNNPIIDWNKKTLKMKGGSIVRAWQPTRIRDGPVDEETWNMYQGMHIIQAPNKDDSRQKRSALTSTPTGESGSNVKGEGDDEPLDIPEEYQQWEPLFREGSKSDALPQHQAWDHKIPLMPGKEPTFGPIYQLSENELKVLDQYLKDNVAKGFIRPSQSSAGYPILFVKKKDGTLRLCVDYRKLNDITIKNRYPLPNADELRDRLQGAQWFTKLDMRGAYNLIRMAKGEEWKTAFRTRYGLYEYLVMPFGLTNAPASCQEVVNNVLRAHLDQCAIAYLDDILIYSKTMEQHVKDVKNILQCLTTVRLLLKPEKCDFHKKSVQFLGYVITVDGIQPDPEKIQAILEWPTPKNVKDIQSFLGTINFNRRFISGFSTLAMPMTKLTKKETNFEWGQEQRKAFEDLKAACTKAPVLRTFQTGLPIRIETDASDMATGGCLLQQNDGKWHPIAYHSRKLTDPEQNYDIHDKELLAVVTALQHWRVYAEGSSDIEIYTDHKNLIHFTTTKQLNKRQVRWSELLGQYKFKIIYTPGKDNETADGLSRRPDHMGDKVIQEKSILHMDKAGNLEPSQQLMTIMRAAPEDDILKKITECYETDEVAKQLQEDQGKRRIIKYAQGIYLPQQLQEETIRNFHDNPQYGHPGIARTVNLLQRHYNFPKMKDAVRQYIEECPSCKKNKAENHAKYGELQKLPLPEFPWASLTMDFITKLPPSCDPADGIIYDAIMVIVDRHTKYTTILPFKETYDAIKLGYIFLDRIIRNRGFPKEIISDRDKLFTSAYWKTVLGETGIKLKLSSAYHPETDGQTERANRTIKTYLRHYVQQNQSNWVTLLPMAELSYNNLLSTVTGTTPFYANYGRNPNMFEPKLPNPKSELAIKTTQDLQALHEQIKERIEFAQLRMEKNENKTRIHGPQLKEGDKVYLHTKNLKTKRPSKKLDHVRVGPFEIEKVKGPVNYQLRLPSDAKVHPVFHVSLLEPASPNTPIATTFNYEPEEENEYEVEHILKHKDNQYLVKWKGYPESENTWEPKKNLLPNCWKMIQEFQATHTTTKKGRPRGKNHRRNP